jgi:peptide/nickel transport system permease protein
MVAYLIRRLFAAFFVLLLVLVLLSLAVHIVPGDPVRGILGPRASQESIQDVRDQLGLNDSVPVQVWTFVTGAIQGDLGADFVTKIPVRTYIAQNLPDTLTLALASLVLTILLAVPLGVYSATHPGSVLDRITMVGSVGLLTVPSYVAGLLLLYLFAVKLQWFSSIGAGSMSNPVDYAKHLLLPAVALAISWVGYLARLLRTSLVEVLGTNYIRTARAYGLSPWRIHYVHALKNALIPTVAILGVAFGNLMGSAVFVEIIFGRPGLGSMVYNGILSRDYPVVRGGVLTLAAFFILANLLADVTYRLLDPRIRRQAH